jgi:hypothetical protein
MPLYLPAFAGSIRNADPGFEPHAEAIQSIKNSIRKNQNQKPPNRKCSYLKDNPSCLALANQT